MRRSIICCCPSLAVRARVRACQWDVARHGRRGQTAADRNGALSGDPIWRFENCPIQSGNRSSKITFAFHFQLSPSPAGPLLQRHRILDQDNQLPMVAGARALKIIDYLAAFGGALAQWPCGGEVNLDLPPWPHRAPGGVGDEGRLSFDGRRSISS